MHLHERVISSGSLQNPPETEPSSKVVRLPSEPEEVSSPERRRQSDAQRKIRQGTNLSASSANSRIRLAYWKRKQVRVDSFDDIKDIPGNEILVLDTGRYVIKKKVDMQAKGI